MTDTDSGRPADDTERTVAVSNNKVLQVEERAENSDTRRQQRMRREAAATLTELEEACQNALIINGVAGERLASN